VEPVLARVKLVVAVVEDTSVAVVVHAKQMALKTVAAVEALAMFSQLARR
jgi:hypothetical protein